MSDLYILLGILIFIGLAAWKISNWRISEKELERARKAGKIEGKIDEAVAEKELEHKKDLSAASDFERARRMWDDKPPKT